MSTPLKIRDIRASKHKSGGFAALSLYFQGKNDAGEQVYAFLTNEIHLVKCLRANLLIANNIMSPKSFIIDVKRRSIFVRSCGITVSIDIKQKELFLTRTLLASQETVVLPRSKVIVLLVFLSLPDD